MFFPPVNTCNAITNNPRYFLLSIVIQLGSNSQIIFRNFPNGVDCIDFFETIHKLVEHIDKSLMSITLTAYYNFTSIVP